MARRAHGPIPMFELDPGRAMPLHRQITEGLRKAILQGRLPAGTRLPSTRSLAEDLEVSRSTVLIAIDQLKAEGYVRTRRGSGTFVPHGLALAEPGSARRGSESEGSLPRPPPPRAPRPFFPGVPATDELAGSAFGRILRQVWREGDPALLAEGPLAGDLHLRWAVCRHLRGSRGVRCRPPDVIITSGAQEGISLALEATVEAGDEVWMENPGYLGARRAILAADALPLPVPVDGEGVRVPEGIRTAGGARAAYVTPSHQFPTGAPLSLARRLQLLRWAAEGERWIIEDDYDSEFRLEGRPLPALQGLDDSGRVVYVGTFSKALAPALRLGFMVVPSSLREIVLEVKKARTGPASRWIQSVTARFLEEGHFARHIRRTRTLYRDRRDLFAAALTQRLGDRATLREPTGAMHAILDLPSDVDPEAVARTCGDAGVDVVPLSELSFPGTDTGRALVLGFSGYGEKETRTGVGILGKVLVEAFEV